MLRNLSNFASLELINAEEIKGGCHAPKPCYPVRGCKSKSTKKVKKCKGPTSKPPKPSKYGCAVVQLYS